MLVFRALDLEHPAVGALLYCAVFVVGHQLGDSQRVILALY